MYLPVELFFSWTLFTWFQSLTTLFPHAGQVWRVFSLCFCCCRGLGEVLGSGSPFRTCIASNMHFSHVGVGGGVGGVGGTGGIGVRACSINAANSPSDKER